MTAAQVKSRATTAKTPKWGRFAEIVDQIARSIFARKPWLRTANPEYTAMQHGWNGFFLTPDPVSAPFWRQTGQNWMCSSALARP
jgi:hypothetical protein